MNWKSEGVRIERLGERSRRVFEYEGMKGVIVGHHTFKLYHQVYTHILNHLYESENVKLSILRKLCKQLNFIRDHNETPLMFVLH
jgi:hypothetical protein